MKNIYILFLSILPLVSCSQSNKTENNNKVTPAALKAKDVFTTLQFELDGKPCIAIINNQYKDFKNKSAFPLSLFLMINTLEKDKIGHPTEKESLAFHELQTSIISKLSAEFAFCHIGTTTMTGYRISYFISIPKTRRRRLKY